jgi:hypothetical protein
VGPGKGHICNAECAVISQVMALKRAVVCLRLGVPDVCRVKLVSQQASLWYHRRSFLSSSSVIAA